MTPVSDGKPRTGNPYAQFEEEASAPANPMRHTQLNRKDIYILTSDTRVRQEGEKFILINIATQGLHFISPMAQRVVSHMDGKTSLEEIISSEFPGINADDENVICDFVGKLVERRLIRKIEG